MPPSGGISSLISALRPAATKKSLQRALDTLLGVITLAADSPTDHFKDVATVLLSDLDELYASCPKQVISVVAAIFAHCFETLLLPALERAQPTEKFESVLRGALGGAVEAAKVDSVASKLVAQALFKHVVNLLEARSATQLGVSMLRDSAAFFEDVCGEHRCYGIILEQKLISATRFGKLLVNHNLFFCLQAFLDLLPQLLPSSKERKKRQDFIKNIFDSSATRDMLPPEKRKDITHLVMNANAQEWPKVASQLLAVMAEANPAKPQPFAMANMTIDGLTLSHDRETIVYFDLSGLVSNILDDAGDFEELEIPYKSIISAQPYPFRGSVTLTLKSPPALSATAMQLASSPPHKLVLDIKPENQHRCFQFLSERRLIAQSASDIASTASSQGQRRFSFSQGVPFDATNLSQSEIEQIKVTELQAMCISSPAPAASPHAVQPIAPESLASPVERTSPQRNICTGSVDSDISEPDADTANHLLADMNSITSQNMHQADLPSEYELKSGSAVQSTRNIKNMPAVAAKRSTVAAKRLTILKPTVVINPPATTLTAPDFINDTASSRKRKTPESDEDEDRDFIRPAVSRTTKRVRKTVRIIESSTEDEGREMDINVDGQIKGGARNEKATTSNAEPFIYNSQFLHESSSPAKLRYGRGKARAGTSTAKKTTTRLSRERESVDYEELPGETTAKATIAAKTDIPMTTPSPRSDLLQHKEFKSTIEHQLFADETTTAANVVTVKRKVTAKKATVAGEKTRKATEVTKKRHIEQAGPTSDGDEAGGPVKQPSARRTKAGKAKTDKLPAPPQQDKRKTRAATKRAAVFKCSLDDEIPQETPAADTVTLYDEPPTVDTMEVANEPIFIANENNSDQAREDAAIAADFNRFINFSPTTTIEPHPSSPRPVLTISDSSKSATTLAAGARKVKKPKKAPWDTLEWGPGAAASSDGPAVDIPSSDAALGKVNSSPASKKIATTGGEDDTGQAPAVSPTSRTVEQPMHSASAKLSSNSTTFTASPSLAASLDVPLVKPRSTSTASLASTTHVAPRCTAVGIHSIVNFTSSSDAFCATPPRSSQSLNSRSRAVPEALGTVAAVQAFSNQGSTMIRPALPDLTLDDLPLPISPVDQHSPLVKPVLRARTDPSVAAPLVEPNLANDSDVEMAAVVCSTRSQSQNGIRSPPPPIPAWSEASTLGPDVTSPPPARRDKNRAEKDLAIQDPLIDQLPLPSADMKNKISSAMKSPRSMLKPPHRTVKFAIDVSQEERESPRSPPHAPKGGLLSPLHIQSEAAALRKSPLARRDYLDDEDDASTSEIKDKHLGKILSVLEEMHKTITSRIASNFEQIDAGPVDKQRELFADATKDISIIRDESAVQFKIFVELEERYSGFCTAYGAQWQELIKLDAKMLKAAMKGIQYHDSHSVVKEMPKSLFPRGLPKCFAV